MFLSPDYQCDAEWAYEIKFGLGIDLPLEMIAAIVKLEVARGEESDS